MIGKTRSGFTLIEIMIAMAIFAILSSVMILNFRADAKTKELKNDCQKIVDSLRQAQTMALSGRQVKNSLGNFVIPDSYKFEPICLGSPVSCASISLTASTSPIIVLNSIKLDKSEIYALNNVSINFLPPSADSQIVLNGMVTSSVNMKVRHIQNSALSRCVLYNSISGRIDILDISKCN